MNRRDCDVAENINAIAAKLGAVVMGQVSGDVRAATKLWYRERTRERGECG